MRNPARKQRGVALLVILILLVMMSALAAKISQQFCRHLQKTHYQVSQQQLRWAVLRQQSAIERLLQTTARGENEGLSPQGQWAEPLETHGENYTLVSQIEDAQACFNLNSLQMDVADTTTSEKAPAAAPAPTAESGSTEEAAENPADASASAASAGGPAEKSLKELIVEQLLMESGASTTAAEEVYKQLVDYLDADDITAKQGQEGDAWAGVLPARLPANQMMRTLSELRQLPAFPPSAWAKASTLLCVLPDTEAKVDVNTLTPEQAPLLAAIYTGVLSVDDAKRVLASRPDTGWESPEAFSKALESQYPQTKDVQAQAQEFVAVNSRYFRVNSTGNTDDLTLRVVSQLHVDTEAGKVVTWQRRYRMVE